MEGFSMGKVIPFRQTIPPAPPERLVDEEVTVLKSGADAARQDQAQRRQASEGSMTLTKEEIERLRNWKQDLPSPEHRRHIRLFQGLEWMTDEQDVALQGYVLWRGRNVRAALEKARTNRRTKNVRE
jgi:pyrimidine operon attenuation protein/uracil phosphoribosyltransferase